MQIAPVRGPSFGEVRRYDGGHNNLEHPDWGQTDSVLLRLTPPVYADGEQAPSGDDRPNPREISNQILNERGRYLDPRNLSGMVWAWGQFVDHDITFTPAGSQEWNIAGILFLLEGRGGWGYRLHHPEVPSPYLWNYSTHYAQGKYVTDDAWSETGVAQRCGAAVLLRRLAERGLVVFDHPEEEPDWPLLRYDESVVSPWVEALQRFMNTLPGIYVKVDGRAGQSC